MGLEDTLRWIVDGVSMQALKPGDEHVIAEAVPLVSRQR
jgi:hypothetical protein